MMSSGSLTGRLASKRSATGQTNRRIKPNLSGGALNGRSRNLTHCTHGCECPQPAAPLASGFSNARSVRKEKYIMPQLEPLSFSLVFLDRLTTLYELFAVITRLKIVSARIFL